MKSLTSSAPSNIALIKYMGKIKGESNHPTNSSLSWTLNHLKTFVKITRLPENVGVDEWKALEGDDLFPIRLSEKGRQKFLDHLSFLKGHLNLRDSFLVESANNFPSDCGLASSASSFAALTSAVHKMALELNTIASPLKTIELANLSRKGSGSSSRSFFSPWALWSSNEICSVDMTFDQLHHQVFVVESGKKLVSSSEAHQRVLTSELFVGRPERAEKRLVELTSALRARDWPMAFQVCWAEFWDMHALFETSVPAFGYMEPKTLQVLKVLRQGWSENDDGPLVTMDAGANIHALYRPEQKPLALKIRKQLKDHALILMSDGLTEDL
jgi:diphosphomevalonate decarboxylase